MKPPSIGLTNGQFMDTFDNEIPQPSAFNANYNTIDYYHKPMTKHNSHYHKKGSATRGSNHQSNYQINSGTKRSGTTGGTEGGISIMGTLVP